MRLSSSLILLSLAVAVTACGKTRTIKEVEKVYINVEAPAVETDKQKPLTVVTENTEDEDTVHDDGPRPEAEKNRKYPIDPKVTNAQIECEDKSKCPNYVGSLVISKRLRGNARSYSFCSFTLISENEIITNDHCFGVHDVENKTCEGIYAIFPETNTHPKKIIECESMKALSEQYDVLKSERLDWTILKLKRSVKRNIAKPNTKGVAHNQLLNIYPSYYEKNEDGETNLNPIAAKIKAVSCQASMSSIMMQSYITPFNINVSLECEQELEKGNSGSGVINNNNEIVSVFKTIALDQYHTYMGSRNKIDSRAITATNLHCVSALNPERSELCEKKDPINEDWLFSKIYETKLSESNTDEFESYIKQHNYIKWSKSNSELIKLFAFNDNKQYFSGPYAEHAKNHYFSHKFPKLPSCIHKSTATDHFTLKIPYFEPDYSTAEMSAGGVQSMFMGLHFLGYEATYDSSTNSYKTKLIRHNNYNEINHFFNLSHTFKAARINCEDSAYIENCQRMTDLNSEISFLKSSNSQDFIFNNESQINFQKYDNNEFNIPICN